MGRRQNPAIEAYFERGEKLGDASNRYQQTCRRCGEFFARGRPENLIHHIASKCSVVSAEERADFINLYDTSKTTAPPAKKLKPSMSGNLPDVSALNTLAEASHQHSHLRISPSQDASQAGYASNGTIMNPEHLRESAHIAMSFGHDQDAAITTPKPNPVSNAAQNQRRDKSKSGAPNATMAQPSSLQMTALSALDPMLDYSNITVPLVDYAVTVSGLSKLTSAQQPSEGSSAATASSNATAIPTTNTTTFVGTATLQKRVRGAFSPQARAKVRNVRKMGACMRCRMLKKPCGDQDPCRECAKLENARVWKGNCVRVRLTELFTVYQSNFFRVTAHHAEQLVKIPDQYDRMEGRVEVTLFPKSNMYLTFPWILTATNVALLSELSINGTDKIKEYVFKVLESLQNSDNIVIPASQFTQHTLRWAASACSGSQDNLLAKALELWVCTYIMSSLQSKFHAILNFTTSPSDTVVMLPSTDVEKRNDLSKSTDAASIEVISKQLKSVAEQRAGFLCKAILKEFEHHIILRRLYSNVELLVTAVLVLLAAERICCFIKQFDTGPHNSSTINSTGTVSEAASEFNTSTLPSAINFNTPRDRAGSSWPLDREPEAFWQQGEQLSSVLALMLKLRVMTPKMVTDEEGFIRAPVGENEEMKAWLDGLRLKPGQLVAASMKPFDADDHEFWELRWASKPLLT